MFKLSQIYRLPKVYTRISFKLFESKIDIEITSQKTLSKLLAIQSLIGGEDMPPSFDIAAAQNRYHELSIVERNVPLAKDLWQKLSKYRKQSRKS